MVLLTVMSKFYAVETLFRKGSYFFVMKYIKNTVKINRILTLILWNNVQKSKWAVKFFVFEL